MSDFYGFFVREIKSENFVYIFCFPCVVWPLGLYCKMWCRTCTCRSHLLHTLYMYMCMYVSTLYMYMYMNECVVMLIIVFSMCSIYFTFIHVHACIGTMHMFTLHLMVSNAWSLHLRVQYFKAEVIHVASITNVWFLRILFLISGFF